MKIQILGKNVRVELSTGNERGNPEVKSFDLKFYYGPFEYSRDSYEWELIRDFKENKHSREIHNSLNGLIAFLENSSR